MSCASTSCAASRSSMRSIARTAPSCRPTSTARCARRRPGGPATEIPFPAFEIAVFDNRFPAFQAPAGAAEVVVYTDDHHGSFAALAAAARASADVGLAPALRGARRARGRRLRADLREPRRRGRGDAAPPARPDLRLSRSCRRCRRSSSPPTRGSAAARSARCSTASWPTAAGPATRTNRSSPIVPYAARWPYETHVVMREHRAQPARVRRGRARVARRRRCRR